MTEHKGLYVALAAAQAAMGPALKENVNPAFKSKYADLANVMAACLPALNAHGIAVIQPPFQDDAGNRYVKTVFIHGASGESVECAVPLIVGKNDMQGYGSAVTYARRYGLMSMAGIAPEDDDGEAAAKSPPRDDGPRQNGGGGGRSAYDPIPHVAAIEAAMNGRELLDAIRAKGCDNAHPAIAAARVDRLALLIKGAQSVDALDQFAKAFAADWVNVSGAAQMRRVELTTAEIPH